MIEDFQRQIDSEKQASLRDYEDFKRKTQAWENELNMNH